MDISQNFDTQSIISPDIDQYYTRIIQEIDRYRSRFDATTSNISQTISQENLDVIFIRNATNSLTAQESRCNAFFRMIGFPVVASNGPGDLYSPGFDPSLNKDKSRISKNLTIAQSMLNQTKSILDSRENYPRTILNIFQNKDANATALAISSIYVRPFDKQFKDNIQPLDIDRQEFIVSDREKCKCKFF